MSDETKLTATALYRAVMIGAIALVGTLVGIMYSQNGDTLKSNHADIRSMVDILTDVRLKVSDIGGDVKAIKATSEAQNDRIKLLERRLPYRGIEPLPTPPQ
jgi:hypothetical protein